MRFHFALYNHYEHSQETLKDVYLPIMHALQELGHECSANSHLSFRTEVMNVIVEHFPQGWEKALWEPTARGPLKYGVVMTEMFDGNGLNYQSSHEWRDRFQGFMNALQGAKFIWSLAGGSNFYKQICPAADIDIGWDPKLEWDYTMAKAWDFILTGSPSPDRERLVDSLRKDGHKVYWARDCSNMQRNRMANCSSWSLGVKPSISIPIPSATRIVSSIQAGCPVILEPVAVETDLYNAVAPVAPPWMDDWENTCSNTLKLPTESQGWWELQRDALKKRPMVGIIAAALDATLAK